MFASISIALVAASLVSAQIDPNAPLDKPTLVDSLDYLNDGLESNLPLTDYNSDLWDAGMIPSSCKSIAEGQSLAPADFQIYNITYNDVSTSIGIARPFKTNELSVVWRSMGFLSSQELECHHRFDGSAIRPPAHPNARMDSSRCRRSR
jgi:hypothetical protein